MRLLVAEDDQRLARIVKRGIEGDGHVVDVVHDGDAALLSALDPAYDVLVLDGMMPGLDGFEVVRRLRDRRVSTPALLLTARGELEDRVRGLDSGADDYLVKPFAFEELSARIRALGRRSTVQQPTLTAGHVELDVVRHEVRVHDTASLRRARLNADADLGAAAYSVTLEGLLLMERQLEEEKAKRPYIADKLREAMADKDFRENAPLDAARDEQGRARRRAAAARAAGGPGFATNGFVENERIRERSRTISTMAAECLL